MMKRIDSFFIKCDTPKKKQCVDQQVKEDEAQLATRNLKTLRVLNVQATQIRTLAK